MRSVLSEKPTCRVGFFLIFALMLLVIFRFVGLSQLTPNAIRNLLAPVGWWGPVLYISLYTIRPLLFFPAIILTLAGGLLFGPWWGTFYVLLGGLSGACLCFGISKCIGREKARKYFGKFMKIDEWDRKSKEYGFKTILFMRLVPVFPYDPVSFLAGVSNIRFKDFVLATAIGMVPGAVAYNVVGSSLTNVYSPVFLISIVFAVVVMSLPMFCFFIKNNKYRKNSITKVTI